MSVDTIVPLDHRATLAQTQATFLALFRHVEPTARVPGCPDWDAAHLTAHLTGVHRWAAAMSRTAPGTDDVPDDVPDDADPPVARDAAQEYRAAAADLLAVLDEDPDRPCRTLTGAGRRRDWARRQLHETLVHTWDLADAGGLPRWGPPEVVADAVEEVLDTLHPRQVRLGRTPGPDVSVELLGSRRWVLGDGPLVAAVAGADADLLRLLWRRSDLSGAGLVVTGDAARATELLAGRLTP
ncbi:maleylpyruvate isomerase family mycothiol-dependent enzyme [Kineococcus sp. NBC_00420]|uniref:maleylpyruvate isomerase family mycothiol-dependent enzyme n=1 Tax=Kineococcus sp. NBC_00420 TaxID=2903564 RepID=UPI002E23432F